MSVALPAVNATMMCTGLFGKFCAKPEPAHRHPKTSAGKSRLNIITASVEVLVKAIAHGHVLRDKLQSRCFGLQQQQLGEVLLGHAAPDQRLHDIARERGERHRHLEPPAGVEPEVEILAQ